MYSVGEMCALHGRDEEEVVEVGRVRGVVRKSSSKVVRLCRLSHTLHGHDNHPTRSLPEYTTSTSRTVGFI